MKTCDGDEAALVCWQNRSGGPMPELKRPIAPARYRARRGPPMKRLGFIFATAAGTILSLLPAANQPRKPFRHRE